MVRSNSMQQYGRAVQGYLSKCHVLQHFQLRTANSCHAPCVAT